MKRLLEKIKVMAHVKCTFLGYPQIRFNDDIIEEFISSKALMLACYLILHPHKIHARDALAAYFWGEMSAQRAKANLRQALHNIQKLLPDFFEVSRQSVQVAGHGFECDVFVLEALAESENLSTEYLLEGVSYYHGEFLEGLYVDDAPEIEDWLRHQRERYRLLFLDLLESLSNRYFSQGEWTQAEKYYRQLLSIEPWQDKAHRQVMLCLARQGNFSQALNYFQNLQDDFFNEFGTNLTPQTRLIYEQIQHAQAFAHNRLPSTPPCLIAREEDVANIRKLLFQEHVRLVTIFGMGGLGKTHLAQQMMVELQQSFLHGILWVDLTAKTNLVEAIYDTLVDTQYIPELKQLDVDLADHILNHVKTYELLLILDNLEHLVEHNQFLPFLLNNTANIKFLTTSRRQLTLQSEYVYHLAGLTWITDDVHLGDQIQDGASQLFLHFAQQIRQDFMLTEQNIADVMHICELVEGLPLALRLVASWIDHFTPRQIAEQIQTNIETFISRAQDVPERHVSISSTLDYSLDLLSESEAKVLLKLGVFRSSFDLQAAIAVAGANLLVLSHLVSKSLVLIDETSRQHGSTRYRLHELVRQYLNDELQATMVQYQEAQAQFVNYYLHQIPQQLGQSSGDHITKLAIMHIELDNLQQAWQMALTQENIDELTEITTWFRYYYDAYGYWRGYQFFQNTLDNLPVAYMHEPFALKIKVYTAFLLAWIGQYTPAKAILDELLSMSLDNREIQAHSNLIYGHIHAYYGDGYNVGIEYFVKAAEIFRDLNDGYTLARCLVELGRTYAIIGRTYEDNVSEIPTLIPETIDQCMAYLDEAEDCYAQIKAQVIGEANILQLRGYINYLWGRDALAHNQEALPYFHKAIDIFQQIINSTTKHSGRQEHCGTLNWLGIAYVFSDQDELAVQTFIRAIDCSLYSRRLHVLMDTFCNTGKFYHRKNLYLPEIARLFAYIEHDKATDARIRKWGSLYLEDIAAQLGQTERNYFLNLVRHESHADMAEFAKRLLRNFTA